MRNTLMLSAVFGIVFFVASRFYGATWVHPFWPYILLFYVAVAALLYRLMSFVKDPKSAQFTTFYLAFVTAKLILSFIFMGVLLYNGVAGRATFVITFLVLYLVYTSFEIYGLTRKLRRDS